MRSRGTRVERARQRGRATVGGSMSSLNKLALIGNGQLAALVDADGSIRWCCWPRFDSDPIFCGLLMDDSQQAEGSSRPGDFTIELVGQCEMEIGYQRNTAIVTSTARDKLGNAIRVETFCPRFRRNGRIFHPTMLVRRVTAQSGRPVVRVALTPAESYGLRPLEARHGSHHIRFTGAKQALRLTTDASLTQVLDSRPFVLEQTLTFVLAPDETLASRPDLLAKEYLDETAQYWRDWVRSLAIPFEWQAATIRAAIALKLCAFDDTGAIIAAPTTSIPEVPGSGRTWDYRYCWLRDAYFTVHALNRLGATRTMESYLGYIDNIMATNSESLLQPVYGIGGESELAESEIASLVGYRGMGPVRVGNGAFAQVQNDVYGSVILASTQAFFDERLERPGGLALFAQLERFGERAVRLAERPDAGLWEFRGTVRHHTFSATMCWAAADRLARIAGALGLQVRTEYWETHAADLKRRILARAWSDRLGAFSADLDRDSIDASLLLLPELGLVGWRDPRFVQTLACVERDLSRDGLLLRYAHADDFGQPANAFTICSFWLANALWETGRVDDARSLFERLLGVRNATGLLAEDVDPVSGELWGNFPQTYSMVGIITTAMRLSRRWEDAL